MKYEIADIFRLYGKAYRDQNNLSYKKLKVIHKIEICRTARLGGHVEQCDQCGFERIAYNSCRDRHCPKCQTMVKEKWLNDRKADLLPCNYFHMVFTIPHELNPIVLTNPKVMLNNLFAAVSKPPKEKAYNPHSWRSSINYPPVLTFYRFVVLRKSVQNAVIVMQQSIKRSSNNIMKNFQRLLSG